MGSHDLRSFFVSAPPALAQCRTVRPGAGAHAFVVAEDLQVHCYGDQGFDEIYDDDDDGAGALLATRMVMGTVMHSTA